jgi:hypothetical protein
MPDVGSFTAHPELAALPPLVRKQRTLEAKIAPLAPLVEDEKKVRSDIDSLLLAAGITKSEHVTCNGYDVAHVERVGTSRLNQEALTLLLVKAGLSLDAIALAFTACTETGDPSMWATVKPSKGAKVRK